MPQFSARSLFSRFGNFVIPLAIIALLAALAWSLTNKDRAPDVTFTTVQGQSIRLSALQGKLVLINFWATDCPGCVEEIPKLVETYRQYHARGFEVVAVAMPYDSASQVVNYTQKNALPFPVMHDLQGRVTDQFSDIKVTPTSYVIDKNGQIIRRIIGEVDFDALRSLLNEQLGQPDKLAHASAAALATSKSPT